MNYRMIAYIISRVLFIEALLLLVPLLVSLYFGENALGFLVAIAAAILVAAVLSIAKPKTKAFFSKEGFICVGLSWLAMSFIGAIPFVVSGDIPNYIDAWFETVSGFTTTGSTILTDVEAMGMGMLFWRSFTHWIGGMGILVFMMAIIPMSNEYSMYIMRAEVAGPTVGKLVPKAKKTARILYISYFALTALEIILLKAGGMGLYESVVHSFATAGTGGFGIKNLSIGFYNSAYIQMVIGIFMLLFGINFNLYFFLFVGKIKNFFKNEELRVYLIIIAIATVIIGFNIHGMYDSASESFRHAFFQTSSIMTTTGFSTVDFNTWPELSKTILFMLMFVGGCAGSTGGGLKVSRILIIIKSAICEVKRMHHPRSVNYVRMEGHKVPDQVVKSTLAYFGLACLILIAGFVLVSIDNKDFTTSATSVVSCFMNIGPGLNLTGPAGNFALFSHFSKIVLSVMMLLGRLEIFPILLLVFPKTWKRR